MVVVMLMVVCTLVALGTLSWPLYVDHGIFVLVGESVARGHVPYVEAFDTKGPLAFVPYALVPLMPFAAPVAVRVLDLVILAAFAFVAHQALRPSVGRVASAVAIAFVMLGYVSTGFVIAAQVDSWCGLVIGLAAVVAIHRFRHAPVTAGVVYGVAVAACTWVKPTFLAFGVAPLAGWFWLDIVGRRTLARAFGAAAAAGVAVSAMVVAWFAAHGALTTLLEVQWTYNRTSYAVVGSMSPLRRVVPIISEFTRGSEYFLFPVLWPGVGAFLLDPRLNRAVRAFAVAIVAAAILNIVAQGKFLVYQWVPVAVPLWIMAGLGFVRAVQDAEELRTRWPALRRAAQLAFMVAFASVLVGPVRDVARSAALLLGADRDAYLARMEFGSGYNGLGQLQAARYVAAHTRPAERFAHWGLGADIAVLAGRPVVSRFVHSDPLRFGIGPIADRYRAEYLREFDRARPRYYVMPGEPTDTVANANMRLQFPALIERLDRDYRFDAAVQSYVILRRKDDP